MEEIQKKFIDERNNITINPVHNRISLNKICNLNDFKKGFKTGFSFWENGEFLRKSGDFEGAIELFNQARYYGYLAPALYTSYAMVYRKLEDYDNEIDILDEALKVCKNEIALEKFEFRRHKAIYLFIKQQETVINNPNSHKL